METFNIFLKKITDVSDFVNLASKCKGDVLVKSGKYTVSGKSIMGVFSLDLSKPLMVEIHDEIPADVRKALIENFIG